MTARALSFAARPFRGHIEGKNAAGAGGSNVEGGVAMQHEVHGLRELLALRCAPRAAPTPPRIS